MKELNEKIKVEEVLSLYQEVPKFTYVAKHTGLTTKKISQIVHSNLSKKKLEKIKQAYVLAKKQKYLIKLGELYRTDDQFRQTAIERSKLRYRKIIKQ